MPNITEGAIRQALKRAEKTQKQESLTDGEGRGTGRLALPWQINEALRI